MTSKGYITIWLAPTDFFYPMADGRKRVLEHRLVMARHMKRCLLPWEVVHHVNGIRNDNRIENLQLLAGRKHHLVDTNIKREVERLNKAIRVLQARVTILEGENTLLKVQLAAGTVVA